jgi:flagellin
MRINDNIMSLNAYRNLSQTESNMGKSLEKLSSGFRINRAADDAAGLVISEGLSAQVSGLQQATRNAQDGISVVQTAEGALNQVNVMLNRMRDLAVQAANGSNDPAARAAANNEIVELKSEISRVAGQTKFGTQSLLDGTYGNQAATITGTAFLGTAGHIVVGSGGTAGTATVVVDGTTSYAVAITAGSYSSAASYQTQLQADFNAVAGLSAAVTVTVHDLGNNAFRVDITRTTSATGSSLNVTGTPTVAAPGVAAGSSAQVTGQGGVFQIGANANETISVSIGALSNAGGTGLADVAGDVLTTTNSESFISAVDVAIANVSGLRGQLGAKQNRLESSVASLQVATENLTASNSQIRDTDMAMEMTNFTKDQILMQAGTAMLGQANKIPQSVLSLLQG